MVAGMAGATSWQAEGYSLGMLAGVRVRVEKSVGRRGQLGSQWSRRSRAGLQGACGGVLSVMRISSGGAERRGRLVALPPIDTPISRLSDAVPPYTASTPVVSPASRVKLPNPRLLMVTSNTSGPPLGPKKTCVSLLLLTNTSGGLLDGDVHKATDMVSWNADGREKRRGVEDEKLLPERERGELRDRDGVLCGRTRGKERNNETSGQSIFLARPFVRHFSLGH